MSARLGFVSISGLGFGVHVKANTQFVREKLGKLRVVFNTRNKSTGKLHLLVGSLFRPPANRRGS